MKAIVISLNGVIDTHLYLHNFKLNEENFITAKNSFAAGKGTNVARFLRLLSVPFELFVLIGEENGEKYKELLKKDKMDATIFQCKGKTRENISIHSSNTLETRLCEDSFVADEVSCEKLFNEALNKTSFGDVVVFCGRFPKGVSDDFISSSLLRFKGKNAKLVLDSASFSIKDYSTLKPFLIKPNEDELKKYGDTKKSAIKNLLRCDIENIAYSQGKRGIELYQGDKITTAKAPQIKALSTVGAGDSSIAGFICSIYKNLDKSQMLRLAVACGSANCLTPGGILPSHEDIVNCFEATSVFEA